MANFLYVLFRFEFERTTLYRLGTTFLRDFLTVEIIPGTEAVLLSPEKDAVEIGPKRLRDLPHNLSSAEETKTSETVRMPKGEGVPEYKEEENGGQTDIFQRMFGINSRFFRKRWARNEIE